MHFLICFILGGTSVLAMPPWGFFPAMVLGLSGLYYCVANSASMAKAFAKGWVFAFSYFFFGLMWVGNALLVEGNDYAWAWPLAVCGLPFMLAFFPAFGCAFAHRFGNLKSALGLFVFVAYLALFEWVRGMAFTGFPWNLYGYSWIKVPAILQSLALVGAYGLTFFTVLWCALPGFVFASSAARIHKQLVCVSVLASLAFFASFGYWRLEAATTATGPAANIRLVQANIPQHEKWEPEKIWGNFLRYIALSRPENDTARPTYIIWPETSLNPWVMQEPRAQYLLKHTLGMYKGPAYLMTGLLRKDDQGRFYNSLVMIDKTGNVTNVYNKSHLVPFGEYIPLQRWIPLEPVARFRGFTGDKTADTFKTPEGINYSPAICYEIIFPGRFPEGKNKSQLIINVTNDSWYGLSSGPWQHFYQAVFRAIEQGVPVARAADTGISGVIDSYGRIAAQSQLEEVYASEFPIPPVSTGIRFSNSIQLMIFIALITFSACVEFLSRRSK